MHPPLSSRRNVLLPPVRRSAAQHGVSAPTGAAAYAAPTPWDAPYDGGHNFDTPRASAWGGESFPRHAAPASPHGSRRAEAYAYEPARFQSNAAATYESEPAHEAELDAANDLALAWKSAYEAVAARNRQLDTDNDAAPPLPGRRHCASTAAWTGGTALRSSTSFTRPDDSNAYVVRDALLQWLPLAMLGIIVALLIAALAVGAAHARTQRRMARLYEWYLFRHAHGLAPGVRSPAHYHYPARHDADAGADADSTVGYGHARRGVTKTHAAYVNGSPPRPPAAWPRGYSYPRTTGFAHEQAQQTHGAPASALPPPSFLPVPTTAM